MALFHGFHAQGPMGGEGLADTWPFDSVLSSKCGEFLLCLPLHLQRNPTGPSQPKRLGESGLTNDSPCLPPARKPPFGKACPVSRNTSHQDLSGSLFFMRAPAEGRAHTRQRAALHPGDVPSASVLQHGWQAGDGTHTHTGQGEK